MGDALEEGRRAYAAEDWALAYRRLSDAARRHRVNADDLHALGIAAYLTGHDRESEECLGRAHRAWQDEDDRVRAAREAFWIGLMMIDRGEMAPASGWFARGERLLEAVGECAERGLFLVPAALGALGTGDFESALDLFGEAGEIGRRCDDPDLCSLSLLGQGQALIALGRSADGLQLLDEVMVSVVAGETSPIVAGLVYCAVIETCQRILDLRRASEWTAALSDWCAAQPDLEPYRGQCLVHRAEVLRHHGAWDDALYEANRARALLGRLPERPAVGAAHHELAELHRLRGEARDAEAAYREASRRGHDPRAGLALLRLQQGRVEEAWSSLRGIDARGDAAGGAASAAELLAATVEVALACGELDAARAAVGDLRAVAADAGTPYLHALADDADGRVMLADGDAAGACAPLRAAVTTWQHLQVPLHAARARVAFGAARLRLGDTDTAGLEFDAARRVFEALGAGPELDALDAWSKPEPDSPPLLTDRELEVLGLAARGLTNREIAETLTISRHTVRRHLQNTFNKLGVSTRAAATAHAYERGLLH